ncbi:MAG: hypothetical protein LBG80_17700 [Bacteroidales bacterium]|nr:hypothetical protein [Bacteroidales bacterium]
MGNNVRIATSALVLGRITVGDNSYIAAGAVVVRNVPTNCMVVSNPAVIKMKDDIKCNIKL